MSKGFFIGRFQPFHRGHEIVIKDIAKEHDYVVIAIGSSQEHHTVDNPFTTKERAEMISKTLGNDFEYTVVPIPDINDYQSWVVHVESLCPDFDVVYTGNKVVRNLFEKAGYIVKPVNHHCYTSATQVRNMICNDEDSWKNLVPKGTLEIITECEGDNRIKKIFNNKFSKPSITVDALVRKNNEVLLIQRDNDPFKGMWALPGGFMDYGQETAEEAVLRELEEETGLNGLRAQLANVYSQPERDPRGHTVTIAYEVEVKGNIKAGTDARKAKFFKLNALPPLAFDHAKIISDWIHGEEEGRNSS